MRWLLIFHQDHTAGDDYLERIPFLGAVIEAPTLRKAQGEARKLYPNIRFGGMFSPLLRQITDEMATLYGGKADRRLSERNRTAHVSARHVLNAH